MMKFSETNLHAKGVAVQYAAKLGNDLAKRVCQAESEVTCKEEAIELIEFYWSMVDEAADDQENNIEIAGVTDLNFGMERLMNISIGYLAKCGYKSEWTDEYNRINGG
ncbi:MAG: hypothetical protein OEY07_20455 [Gammaproteobacteria bacterium]|nr:hypothetical protein [Gammaproteobacteria bacterium]